MTNKPVDLPKILEEVKKLTAETAKLRAELYKLRYHNRSVNHGFGDKEPDSVITKAVSWHAEPLSFRGPGITGILSFIAGALTLAIIHWIHLL